MTKLFRCITLMLIYAVPFSGYADRINVKKQYTIPILSYTIHHGAVTDGKLVRKTKRSKGIDQVRELAGLTTMKFYMEHQ